MGGRGRAGIGAWAWQAPGARTGPPTGGTPAPRRLRAAGARNRTSSVLVLLKSKLIAPATLPAARNGPLGQKESVADRSAFFMIIAARGECARGAGARLDKRPAAHSRHSSRKRGFTAPPALRQPQVDVPGITGTPNHVDHAQGPANSRWCSAPTQRARKRRPDRLPACGDVTEAVRGGLGAAGAPRGAGWRPPPAGRESNAAAAAAVQPSSSTGVVTSGRPGNCALPSVFGSRRHTSLVCRQGSIAFSRVLDRERLAPAAREPPQASCCAPPL